MAIQLGYLREALIQAKVDPILASRALEEVAGLRSFTMGLTINVARLGILLQVWIALMAAVLLSQVGMWAKLGEINGTLAQISAQLARLSN